MSEWSTVEIVEQLKEKSDALYGKLLDDRTREQRHLESGDEHDKFVAEVNTLFDALEGITSQIRLLDDYSWLLNTSLQWQAVAALLKMPRRIKIPDPPIRLWAPTQRLGKEDVDQWLVSLEMQLCKIRHYQEFVHRVRRVEVEQIDKYNAKVYLCRDILGGAMAASGETLDFVEKLPPDVYNYSEEVWFRDVLLVRSILAGWPSRQQFDHSGRSQ